MSEDLGNTQPKEQGDSTQPLKPVKKVPRWRSIFLSILGVLALLVLGGVGGYGGGISDRLKAERSIKGQQLGEQYQLALVDEQFGHYNAAKQRLEFIIQEDPSFPGVQAELAKVLVQLTVPTATLTPTITPTPDLRGDESLFATAQQLIAAGDWTNALVALDQLRKNDPNYKTSQVDGMYYFALRNYGMNLIQQQGNLEGGIYQLTLAEHFAPLDSTANSVREGARAYIQASSFFGVDWRQAVAYFAQVAAGWPALYDGTMNAGQRYHESLMRYGDELWKAHDACAAYEQYQTAMGIGNLDQQAARNANQAYQECYPATEVPTIEPTLSAEPAPTEPPVQETPTVEPTP